MNKPWDHIVILIAIVLVVLPVVTVGWMAFDYLKYSTVTHQTCQGYDWWEDEAECAAEFALDKNDPRYCRIDLLGEVSDLCASIYAEQTIDITTCKQIDLLSAKDKCQQRFE